MKHITKGTIVRTIMLAIVVINYGLQKLGVDAVINVNETLVGTTTEAIISIAVILTAWWKNNSFSPNATKADKFLQDLNKEEE